LIIAITFVLLCQVVKGIEMGLRCGKNWLLAQFKPH
jgi:hypothetical protein